MLRIGGRLGCVSCGMRGVAVEIPLFRQRAHDLQSPQGVRRFPRRKCAAEPTSQSKLHAENERWMQAVVYVNKGFLNPFTASRTLVGSKVDSLISSAGAIPKKRAASRLRYVTDYRKWEVKPGEGARYINSYGIRSWEAHASCPVQETTRQCTVKAVLATVLPVHFKTGNYPYKQELAASLAKGQYLA